MKESKEHILLTSLQLFLQKSFKEVTMKDIVDSSGLSKGAFYHYFTSKNDVFSEVINHFFKEATTIDYYSYSQGSLKAFYTGLLTRYEEKRAALTKTIPVSKNTPFNNNSYYLLFDAMRLLPDFRMNHHRQQQQELKVWKSVIREARKNKEIQKGMSEGQLAKLFIYLSEGTNLHLILGEQVDTRKNELKVLWDGLYNTIKLI